MFYNVAVEVKTQKNKNQRYFDIDNTSLEDIMKFIVNPYKESKKIYINDRFIEFSDITQLQVFKSNQSAKELAEIAQAKVPTNVFIFYNPTNMINENHMQNITKELLFD